VCLHVCVHMDFPVVFLPEMGNKVEYILKSYKTENCLSVCCFFVMHDYRFERICTKFGMWRPYTIRMVGGRGVAIAALARGLVLRAPSVRRCK